MRKFFLAAIAVSALAGAPALAQNTAPGDTAPGGTTSGANPTVNNSGTKANATPPNAVGANVAPAPPPPGANPNGVNPPANAPLAAAPRAGANGPSFVRLKKDDMLSSNVVGLDVYNDRNNNIGKIHDLAVDPSKKIVAYILSVGGFLGMGTHYVLVEPASVEIKFDQKNRTWRATMNATKEQLKAAPEFKYGGQWTASRS